MGDHWVRINGQYELRENLRAAIRAAGISRAEAARRAEMKYSRLTAGLNGSTWLRRGERHCVLHSGSQLRRYWGIRSSKGHRAKPSLITNLRSAICVGTNEQTRKGQLSKSGAGHSAVSAAD